MNNKKKKWKAGSLFSGVLALLGFSGCSSNGNNDYPCLYGTPQVHYRVLGIVTDAQGNPLKDIQVIVDNPGSWGYYNEKESRTSIQPSSFKPTPDTIYTDKDGKFSSHKISAGSDNKLVVEFKDVDGEANGGEFQSKSLTRDEFDKKQLEKGDDYWYAGDNEYSQTVQLQRNNE